MNQNEFGNSKAAIYLRNHVENDQKLRQKVSRVLNHNRRFLNELEFAYNIKALSKDSYIAALNLYRNNLYIFVGDKLASTLTKNVLVIDTRNMFRRAKPFKGKINKFKEQT